MPFTTLLFDLDATLYPAESEVWLEIGKRIELYLRERMGISPEQTKILQKAYYDKYGTTLRGLQHHHQIHPQEYLQFVHDIPVGSYLNADTTLRQMLYSLPQRKWIFTNSDLNHANRVLKALDLADCFDGIISLESLDYECKPHPNVYQIALALSGETNPQQVAYLDDSLRNLAPAKELGLFTIFVNGSGSHPLNSPTNFAPDLTISRPHELVNALPELWQSPSKVLPQVNEPPVNE